MVAFPSQLSLNCSLTNLTRRLESWVQKPRGRGWTLWNREEVRIYLRTNKLFIAWNFLDDEPLENSSDLPPICTKKLKIGILIFVSFAIFYIFIIVYFLCLDWQSTYYEIHFKYIFRLQNISSENTSSSCKLHLIQGSYSIFDRILLILTLPCTRFQNSLKTSSEPLYKILLILKRIAI